jgi:hypothetical protein
MTPPASKTPRRSCRSAALLASGVSTWYRGVILPPSNRLGGHGPKVRRREPLADLESTPWSSTPWSATRSSG